MLKSAESSPMRSNTGIERKKRRKLDISPSARRQISSKLQHNDTPSPFHLFERVPNSGKLPSPRNFSSLSTYLSPATDCNHSIVNEDMKNNFEQDLQENSSASDDNNGCCSFRSHSRTTNQSVQTHYSMMNIQELNSEKAHEHTRELAKEKDDLSKAVDDMKLHISLANNRNTKCSEIIKTLLIEKSEIETMNAKRKCDEDKLRLGHYIMQRQGATFVEHWVDGFAIEILLQQQSNMNKSKEEIEKERKILLKRKPVSKCNSGTPTQNNKTTQQNSDPESSNDKFYEKPLSAQEWFEREEILRIRLSAIRKEELELQLDLEKLGRERHLHIREIKRLDHQQNSRFNNKCTLHGRYLLLSMLGKGGFSEVHKAFDLKEQHYVACKVHQLNREWSDEKKANYIKHALREYNIHKGLDHPRIVRLYDVFEIDNNSFCTVLEYCEGNDLDFVLKQNKNFPEKESRSIIMQIINGLRYLNTNVKPKVIHYDLKPGNIMVGTGPKSGEIKITDFGLSKQMDEECYDPENGMDLTSQGAGTYWYLPPEVFVQGPDPPKISSKVDVWSVGCIFFQCLYGRKPFGHNLSQSAILENNTILKAKEVQFPIKPPASNDAKAFIRKCLTYKVKDRPDILQLSEDEYVQGFFRRGTSNSAASIANNVQTNVPINITNITRTPME